MKWNVSYRDSVTCGVIGSHRRPNLDVIYQSNKRCNQENVIAQLYAARALHAPVDELASNWAYMVMASLSWTLKAWIALSIPEDPIDIFNQFLTVALQ